MSQNKRIINLEIIEHIYSVYNGPRFEINNITLIGNNKVYNELVGMIPIHKVNDDILIPYTYIKDENNEKEDIININITFRSYRDDSQESLSYTMDVNNNYVFPDYLRIMIYKYKQKDIIKEYVNYYDIVNKGPLLIQDQITNFIDFLNIKPDDYSDHIEFAVSVQSKLEYINTNKLNRRYGKFIVYANHNHYDRNSVIKTTINVMFNGILIAEVPTRSVIYINDDMKKLITEVNDMMEDIKETLECKFSEINELMEKHSVYLNNYEKDKNNDE